MPQVSVFRYHPVVVPLVSHSSLRVDPWVESVLQMTTGVGQEGFQAIYC